MNQRNRLIVAAVALFTLVDPRSGRGEVVCSIGSADVVIDASNGVVTGPMSFSTDRSARIEIINLNPFRDNSFALDAKEVEEPGLAAYADLLAFASGSGTTKATDEPADELASARGRRFQALREREWHAYHGDSGLGDRVGVAPAPRDCEAAYLWAVSEAMQIRESLQEQQESVATASAELGEALESPRKTFEQLMEALASPGLTCPEVRTRAALAVGEATAQVAALSASQEGLQAALDVLQDSIEDHDGERKRLAAGLGAACGPVVGPALTLALPSLPSQGDLKEFEAQVKEAKKAENALIKDAGAVASAAGGGMGKHFSVGRYTAPTVVSIAINSKLKSDEEYPDPALAETSLHFGGRQRFTFSAGLGFSGFDRRRFEARPGQVLTQGGDIVLDEGEPKTASIVDLVEDSNYRVLPIVALHTRLTPTLNWHGWVNGLHATLAVTGKIENDNTEVEYLAGFSLSFAEERFFLTLGAHTGFLPELRPGFWVGRELPDGVTAPPLKHERHWQPAVALTYKLR